MRAAVHPSKLRRSETTLLTGGQRLYSWGATGAMRHGVAAVVLAVLVSALAAPSHAAGPTPRRKINENGRCRDVP